MQSQRRYFFGRLNPAEFDGARAQTGGWELCYNRRFGPFFRDALRPARDEERTSMASLAEALYALPTERLRELVRARQISIKKLALMPTKKQLAQHLAGELSKPASVVAALTECDARALRLLQMLVSLEPENRPIPWKRLLHAAGDASLEGALAQVLDGLSARGLAFRLGDSVFLPQPVRASVPASLSARYTLEDRLQAYDAPTLKRICQNLDLRPEQDTKPAIIQAISAHLLQNGPGLRLKRPLDAD